MNTYKLNDIKDAISSIKNGKVVIVIDDESRENEGDFVCASEKISSEIINFMSKEGRGLICCSLEDKRCNQLGLELMVGKNTDIYGTSFTVSVDLIGKGVTTGISASDRSKTILGLVDIKKNPSNFSKPGHIFPLKAISGGVLRRAGHTEASVDLPKISGLFPSGVICEILNADGSMARLPDLLKVAKKFNLKIISIKDLISYRLRNETLIKREDEITLPTEHGNFKLIPFRQINNNQIQNLHLLFNKI